jgi:hypothetical protein
MNCWWGTLQTTSNLRGSPGNGDCLRENLLAGIGVDNLTDL